MTDCLSGDSLKSDSLKVDSPKVTATKKRITDTLMKRLADEPIDRITVGEICGMAHVNRSTFYNHFTDIYDVRDRCEGEAIAALKEMLPALMAKMLLGRGELAADDVEASIGPYYDYIEVLLAGGDPLFAVRMRGFAHDAFVELLGVEHLSERQEYVFNAIASMQMGLMSYWLSTGRSMKLEELFDFIRQLIREGPRSLLLES